MSANYSGGIIITDWYTDNSNKESIKITIKFLSNEIESTSLDVQILMELLIMQLMLALTLMHMEQIPLIPLKLLK